ncbi:MAG TPA: outer membrane protein assembly factor BamD [Candidatus Sulfopaludibacter sp.]|jgi:outer membrane protein assembly factor BamD|nr:outer membrane protein assembly factor BamD [Candidatus Sulfopaludibacter sp.]
MFRYVNRNLVVLGTVAVILIASGCRKKAYENPITKDTQQPDKVLFDTAIDDIEHGRYERARLTLQTLMNTYDTSEYLAKAKLAVADSWFREGGSHGYAQAEAEFKDFILFYPQMEEAAEAQIKICKMEYQQMDKSDRDPLHAYKAQEECKQVVMQFPNSKFAPEALQYMRNVQEVLADEEYKVGVFYSKKGSFPAMANRLQALTDQFPLYSNAADALWLEGLAYQRMGDNFESQQAAAYTKLVREYPTSGHVAEATSRLKSMNRPIPEADPVSYARAKHDQDNKQKRSLLGRAWGPFSSRPDMTMAAKSGNPSMLGLRPGTPASIPAFAAGAGGTSANPGTGGTDSNVTGSVVGNTSLIDKAPNELPGAVNPATNGSAPATATPAGAAAVPATSAPAAAVPATSVPAAGSPDPAAKPINPNAALPMNHTGTAKPRSLAQQQKDMVKQQALFKKSQDRQKKAQAEADKKKAADDAKAGKKKKDQPKAPDGQTPAATPSGKQ